MTKALVIGGTGGIGSQILKDDSSYEVSRVGSLIKNLFPEELDKYLKEEDPSLIVYAAGFTSMSTLKDSTQSRDHWLANYSGFSNILESLQNIRAIFGSNEILKPINIVYLSSVLVKKPVYATKDYVTSKAAAEALVKYSAVEFKKSRIRVNAIRLGYFNVGMINKVPEKTINSLLEKLPYGELGDVVQIDNTIKLLNDNDFYIGSIIDLNGGYY